MSQFPQVQLALKRLRAVIVSANTVTRLGTGKNLAMIDFIQTIVRQHVITLALYPDTYVKYQNDFMHATVSSEKSIGCPDKLITDSLAALPNLSVLQVETITKLLSNYTDINKGLMKIQKNSIPVGALHLDPQPSDYIIKALKESLDWYERTMRLLSFYPHDAEGNTIAMRLAAV